VQSSGKAHDSRFIGADGRHAKGGQKLRRAAFLKYGTLFKVKQKRFDLSISGYSLPTSIF